MSKEFEKVVIMGVNHNSLESIVKVVDICESEDFDIGCVEACRGRIIGEDIEPNSFLIFPDTYNLKTPEEYRMEKNDSDLKPDYESLDKSITPSGFFINIFRKKKRPVFTIDMNISYISEIIVSETNSTDSIESINNGADIKEVMGVKSLDRLRGMRDFCMSYNIVKCSRISHSEKVAVIVGDNHVKDISNFLKHYFREVEVERL